MDTPEGDISAIQSGRMQPLPTYTEHDSSSQPLISTVDPSDTRHIPPTYEKQASSHHFDAEGTSFYDEASGSRESLFVDPSIPHHEDPEHVARERRKVIEGFFEAIRKEQGDVIDLFLTRNLITPNTTDEDGKTPLLAAVATRNIKIVQQLLDAGAEPDTFGVVSKQLNRNIYQEPYTITYRTPLQLSASIGHLPLVKLFLERYACNDALIAPDGQIALRLAATEGHREVVDYLPSRRGGGFLRWKTAHRRSLARAKRALEQIGKFIKFFVWDIEKFFLWTCPKHIIVRPMVKGCKYCWANKKRWFDEFVVEVGKTPERAKKVGKWVWKGIKKIPEGAKAGVKMAGDAGKACWRGLKKLPNLMKDAAVATGNFIKDVAKALWELFTVEIPKLIKRLSIWIWSVLTVRLPKAIAITAKWFYNGLIATLKAIGNIFLKVASLLHTVGAAIVTFFASLSLTDILNGIGSILHAIFVKLPKAIWGWIESFGDASYRVMKAMFGCIGEAVWWLIRGIGYLINYVPRKMWTVFVSMCESIGKGLHEILVWFKPKA